MQFEIQTIVILILYAKPIDEIHIVLTNVVFYFTGPRILFIYF